MKVSEIVNLPSEFYFKSNINPFGLIYRAHILSSQKVIINSEEHVWEMPLSEFRRHLLKDEFEILDSNGKLYENL